MLVQDSLLYFESRGKLFWKACNVVVNRTRRFVIKQHLESNNHTEKVANLPAAEERAQLRMNTLKAVIHNYRTEAELVNGYMCNK